MEITNFLFAIVCQLEIDSFLIRDGILCPFFPFSVGTLSNLILCVAVVSEFLCASVLLYLETLFSWSFFPFCSSTTPEVGGI